MTFDEEQYFEKFKKGDRQAFSFFYKRFINDMYAYGKSLGAKDSLVMDAVQDVFLKVFFNRPSVGSVRHLKYFLLKSLRNRIYDMLNSSSVAKAKPIEGEVLNFSIKTTVLDDIIEEEDRDAVKQMVDKFLSMLSPLQKETLYLRYMQDLDYADIASMLNKSEASIRQLVFQAIRKIRKENKILPTIVFLSLLL